MLAQNKLEQALEIYNKGVPAEHRLSVWELCNHVEVGTISPPDILNDLSRLLTALVRYAYEQGAAEFPVAPPWEQRHGGLRWTIREWPPGPSVRPYGARTIAVDPFAETTLIAIPQHEAVAYTGREILNDFLTLYLPGLPTYPAPQDRDKILEFLAHYGPNFLPYPSPDRSAEDQLDYFSEFNRQYQTFAHAVQSLAEPPGPPPALPPGHMSAPYDPVDNALTNLGDGLDHIKPRLRRLSDGPIVTTYKPTHGLYLCYATLWEAVRSHQPSFKLCALPSCQRPFIPWRKDQTCCTTKHDDAMRQMRRRHRHPR